MARLYKTPNILKKQGRKSYYVDNSSNDIDIKSNHAGTIDSVETRLLKVLDTMIEEKQDWTLPQVMRRAKTSGTSRYRYEAVYKDTIEMIKKYQLGIMPKEEDEKDIPNFDTLEQAVLQRTKQTMTGGAQDNFDSLIYDLKGLISEELFQKASYVSDAYIGFCVNGIRIHPAFANTKDIKERFELICEKYQYVQELKEEYNRLKKEL